MTELTGSSKNSLVQLFKIAAGQVMLDHYVSIAINDNKEVGYNRRIEAFAGTLARAPLTLDPSDQAVY